MASEPSVWIAMSAWNRRISQPSSADALPPPTRMGNARSSAATVRRAITPVTLPDDDGARARLDGDRDAIGRGRVAGRLRAAARADEAALDGHLRLDTRGHLDDDRRRACMDGHGDVPGRLRQDDRE